LARVHLVRHGRAAAGWDTDPDPGLDALGRDQADAVADELARLAPQPVLSSPLRRCRETAEVIAARWGATVAIDPAVAEIPSPEGVPMGGRIAWLRQAMQGTWSALTPRYTAFRDGALARVAAVDADTVIVTHFVAINAVIGAATGDDRLVVRHLDNCSVTVVDVVDGRFHLVAGGREADTLIR
jgi:broad specificity phosphatase PhoE